MIQFLNFLSQADHDGLWRFIQDQEANFVPASVTTGDTSYRKASVCHFFDPWQSRFRKMVTDLAPAWTSYLGLPAFDVAQVEIQLTRSGNGDYFKAHNDSGTANERNRVLSWIYYIHESGFTGGQLRVGDRYVNPLDNSIVIFPSSVDHEILPVACGSRFIDGRVTVGGWIRASCPK